MIALYGFMEQQLWDIKLISIKPITASDERPIPPGREKII